MNHKLFIDTLSEKLGCSSEETQENMDVLISLFNENLKEGNQINISSFGLFYVQMKKEQIIVDPTTKKKMLVPPKLEVKFSGK